MGMCNHFKTVLPAVLGLVIVAFLPAQANQESDQWQFEISPYLFATSLDGTTGADGVTADVDASFDDLFDNLDSAFMFMFEARNLKLDLVCKVCDERLQGQAVGLLVLQRLLN